MRFDKRKKNKKLGPGVLTLDRPVGPTCPTSCPLLDNVCYAQKTEHRFPYTKSFTKDNLRVVKKEILELLRYASKRNKVVRLHERGDFVNNGRLDKAYIRAWKAALKDSIAVGLKLWTYTHVYQKDVFALQKEGMSVYASVHNKADIKKAKKEGARLFAYVLPARKRKGGSYEHPKYVDLPILGRTLVCPEHRLGDRVTCDRCRWCVEGKGNVAFLTH